MQKKFKQKYEEPCVQRHHFILIITGKTVKSPTICSIRDAEQSENLTPDTIQVCSDLVFLKCYQIFFGT